MKIKFKTWFSEEVNICELVDSIIRGHFVTAILKVLYEYPSIKEELLRAIYYFEKFYSSKNFEEDKYYLERLKSMKEIVSNIDRVEKVGNIYIGYKNNEIFANYIELSRVEDSGN